MRAHALTEHLKKVGVHHDALEIRRGHEPAPVAGCLERVMQHNNRLALLWCTVGESVKHNELRVNATWVKNVVPNVRVAVIPILFTRSSEHGTFFYQENILVSQRPAWCFQYNQQAYQ